MSETPTPERPMAPEHEWKSAGGQRYRANPAALMDWEKDLEQWIGSPGHRNTLNELRWELLRLRAERDAALRDAARWKAKAGRQQEALRYLILSHERLAGGPNVNMEFVRATGETAFTFADAREIAADPDGAEAARELEELRAVVERQRTALTDAEFRWQHWKARALAAEGRAAAMVERVREDVAFWRDRVGGMLHPVVALEEIAGKDAPVAGEGGLEPERDPLKDTVDDWRREMAASPGDFREEVPDDDDCVSCGEELERNDCPKSKRPCGHHCNHSWTQDTCCWCGKEFGAQEPPEPERRP